MTEFISDRYKLLEKLGKGGLGEVYRVFDSWENREVAIKIANQENFAKNELEYFKEEYELLKKLKHPGLVEAYDFGYSDSRPYFSMEYVQGKSLEESFKDEGWENFKILLGEICEVLGFIHQRGIIHCDLKPDNIKVTSLPFRIKLLDFGLAEEKGSKINQEPKGTLDFMSPELFQKRPLDERSDLYSLGVILYQSATSRLPFSYSDPVQMVSAHLEEEPKPPRQLNSQIPDTLNELILKLLSKSPDDRFKNASDLKEFLKEKEKIDLKGKVFPTQHLFSGGLFGRQKELSRLWNGLETALDRTGRVFLIEGEAGIGKTELLDELRLKSQLSAKSFFKVRCLEKESQTYVPIIEIISHLFPYLKDKCRLLIAKYSQPLKLLAPQLRLDDEFVQKQVLVGAQYIEPVGQGGGSKPVGVAFMRPEEQKNSGLDLSSPYKEESESVGLGFDSIRHTLRREGNSSPPNQTATEPVGATFIENPLANGGVMTPEEGVSQGRHCEERSNEAIPGKEPQVMSGPSPDIEIVSEVASDTTVNSVPVRNPSGISSPDGHEDTSGSVIPHLMRNPALIKKQMDSCLNRNDKQKNKPNPLDPEVKVSAEDRESLICNLSDFLLQASTVFPFAICFEDLGYADLGTISFLEKLGGNINQSNIFLCASLRPEQIEEKKEVRNLINSLTNKEWFETVKLDRFNLEETQTFIASKLAGSQPPQDAISYLFSHSSGNPLFLLEIMKLFVQKGIIALEKGRWHFDLEKIEEEKVSSQIENILLGNLARYDQKTNDFLKCASLVGVRFDLESAKFLSGLSDDQLFEILFVLLKDEVLRKIPEQAELTYEFSSQSLQKLLYEKFSPSQKKKLHLKLADFLEEKEKHGIIQSKEKLAFHYVNSRDFKKAYRYSLESAEETKKRFAHIQTFKHINNALKSALKLKDQNRFLDALMRRGDLYNSIGELDKALKDYKEILKKAKEVKDERFMARLYKNMSDAYRVKADYRNTLTYSKKALELFTELRDNLERANTLNIIGGIYLVSSQYDKALKAFDEALRTKKTFNDQRSIALTLSNIGVVHLFTNDHERAKNSFGQYLDIVRKLGLKKEIALGLNNLSLVSYLIGEFNTGISYLLESLELSNQIGDEKGICYNYENLGENLLECGDYRKSLEYSERGLNSAQQTGAPRSGNILLNMARAYLEIGNYEKSQESFHKSLKFTEQTKDKNLIASVLLNWTKLHIVLNNTEKQKELLADALKIARKLKDDKLFLEFYEVFGVMNLRENKPEESLIYFRKSEELVNKLKLKNKKMSLDLDFYDAYCKLGQPKKARKYLDKAKELAETTQSKALKAEFYLKSAENEMNEGNLDKSLMDLKESLEIAEKIGKPEFIWKIHHLWAKLNVAKKDFESAYKKLQKASEVLKGLINNIKDEDLKKSYLQDKDKKELLEDIKKVAGLMVGEKV